MKALFKNGGMVVAGIFATIYLVNPGAGIFEILPDNLPFIGNLDEAMAAALLIAVLRHFGLDLTKAFQRKKISNN